MSEKKPKWYQIKTTAACEHFDEVISENVKRGHTYTGAALMSRYEAKKTCKRLNARTGKRVHEPAEYTGIVPKVKHECVEGDSGYCVHCKAWMHCDPATGDLLPEGTVSQ